MFLLANDMLLFGNDMYVFGNEYRPQYGSGVGVGHPPSHGITNGAVIGKT
jgi:hypothetical protein